MTYQILSRRFSAAFLAINIVKSVHNVQGLNDVAPNYGSTLNVLPRNPPRMGSQCNPALQSLPLHRTYSYRTDSALSPP